MAEKYIEKYTSNEVNDRSVCKLVCHNLKLVHLYICPATGTAYNEHLALSILTAFFQVNLV